jgi:ATP-dependent DNA ligase
VSKRYPKIVMAVESLPVRSCVIDGEAIVVNEDGLSIFDILRYRLRDEAAVLCAFDLIEADGADLRRQPLERRKAMLAELLRDVRDGIAFNRHFAGDSAIIFKNAVRPKKIGAADVGHAAGGPDARFAPAFRRPGMSTKPPKTSASATRN